MEFMPSTPSATLGYKLWLLSTFLPPARASMSAYRDERGRKGAQLFSTRFQPSRRE
jgi:hypothetical protein